MACCEDVSVPVVRIEEMGCGLASMLVWELSLAKMRFGLGRGAVPGVLPCSLDTCPAPANWL